MATRRTSRVATRGSRYSYGARAVATAAVAKTATTSSSRSDPAYIAAQIRNVVEARDHQALTDLQAGKLLPFIVYAEERIGYAQDDADRARWTKLLDDAKQKNEENIVASGVASGDVPLEDAKAFLEMRRGQYETHDPRFADLSQQISDVKNAIQARDFNAELNTAMSVMIDAGSTIAAKQKYLETLVKVLPRAKDPKAISTIQKQMGDLSDSIKQDKITARSTETSAKLVDYYNGTLSGGGAAMRDFLLEKANTALSSQEAAAYATAASQVATRERTLQTARVSAAAGTGAAKAVTDALAPLTKSTTAATKAFTLGTKSTGLPDPKAFDTLKEASQTELDTIERALPNTTGAAADALVKRRDALLTAVNSAQRAAAVKTVQTEKDMTTTFNNTLDSLRKSGAPYEETAKLAAQRVAAVTAAKALPWMAGFEQDPTLGGDLTAIEQKVRKMLTDEASAQTGLLTGQTPVTKKLQTEYDRYREYFVKKGTQTPLQMDEWLRAMTDEQNPGTLSDILQLPKTPADLAALRAEQDNIRRMRQDRHNEVQVAADNLIAASWPRTDTGARLDYNAPIPGETPNATGPGRSQWFDPTRGGMFDPNVFGPLITAHGRGGEQGMPSSTDPSVVQPDQTGAPPVDNSGVPPPIDEMAASRDRQRLAMMDPHDAADHVLSQPTPFEYPTWEIPNLPDWGAFAAGGSGGPSLDAGYTSSYTPPALNFPPGAFTPPPLPSYSPTGPSFDPGIGSGFTPPPPAPAYALPERAAGAAAGTPY